MTRTATRLAALAVPQTGDTSSMLWLYILLGVAVVALVVLLLLRARRGPKGGADTTAPTNSPAAADDDTPAEPAPEKATDEEDAGKETHAPGEKNEDGPSS